MNLVRGSRSVCVFPRCLHNSFGDHNRFLLKVSPLHSWQWPAMNFRVSTVRKPPEDIPTQRKNRRSSNYYRCENLITNITPFEATHEWHAVRLQLKPYHCLFLSSRLRHAFGCPVGTLDTYWWFSTVVSVCLLCSQACIDEMCDLQRSSVVL